MDSNRYCSIILSIFIFFLSIYLIISGFKLGVASIYANSLNNSVLYLSSSNISHNHIESLEKNLNNMMWLDSDNPNNLTLAASFYSWKHYLQNQENKLLSTDVSSELLLAEGFEERALELRPTWPESHSQHAYYLWRLGRSSHDIFNAISYAKFVGAKETITAHVALEYYLANLSMLDDQERQSVSLYLLEPEKYGLSYDDVSSIVSRSPNKYRACFLFDYYYLNIKACD